MDPKKLNWLSGQHIINLQTDFILDSIRNIEPEWGKGYEISYLVKIIVVEDPPPPMSPPALEKF